mmetsp:Transcript_12731/g.27021  ORF Transcript_12731/g.27021 Transcript_12731/m.27021 type:complete len:218 (-) Transcript_12731:441-1094(-)
MFPAPRVKSLMKTLHRRHLVLWLQRAKMNAKNLLVASCLCHSPSHLSLVCTPRLSPAEDLSEIHRIMNRRKVCVLKPRPVLLRLPAPSRVCVLTARCPPFQASGPASRAVDRRHQHLCAALARVRRPHHHRAIQFLRHVIPPRPIGCSMRMLASLCRHQACHRMIISRVQARPVACRPIPLSGLTLGFLSCPIPLRTLKARAPAVQASGIHLAKHRQ